MTSREISDAPKMKEVLDAMSIMGISAQEQNEIMAIVATVLHLGNIGIIEEEGMAVLTNKFHVEAAASVRYMILSKHLNVDVR